MHEGISMLQFIVNRCDAQIPWLSENTLKKEGEKQTREGKKAQHGKTQTMLNDRIIIFFKSEVENMSNTW